MKKLEFADGLDLPIDVVTQKLAFMGRTGSGKTYAATKLAEELLRAGAQVIALDPVGVWWGLRLEADGKTPSDLKLPIFGGLHGDIPLEATGGKLMADLIVDRALSCVLDVSQFESDTEKARFAKDFCDRFFFRKKAAPSAVMLFIEEAQEFVPQNPQREEAHMLHAFQRAIKLGRNFGLGVALVSQRPQDINKKALNQTELLFAFQLTGPQERKAIALWVEEKGGDLDLVEILPKLAVGQAHAWSPQWLRISKTVKVSEKSTFDASSTPTFGAKAVESKPLGHIELAELRDKLAATIEKAKAEDPKELRRQLAERDSRIRQLERGTATKTVERVVVDQGAIDKAVRAALTRERKALRPLVERLQRSAATIASLPAQVGDVAAIINAPLAEVPAAEPAVQITTPEPRGSSTPVYDRLAKERMRQVWEKTADDLDRAILGELAMNGGKQRILNAIANLNALGVERPTIIQVALFNGVSHTTGTFKQNVRELVAMGLIDRDAAGSVELAAAGRELAETPDTDRTDDPIGFWKEKLGQSRAAMLALIVGAFPKSISRDEIAASLNKSPTTGTFKQDLRDMRTYGLVQFGTGGTVRANDVLFPLGV